MYTYVMIMQTEREIHTVDTVVRLASGHGTLGRYTILIWQQLTTIEIKDHHRSLHDDSLSFGD